MNPRFCAARALVLGRPDSQQKTLSCPGRLAAVAALAFALGTAAATAQVNSWLKPTSGNWEEPFWSLGILPNSTQTVEITNAGWKAVAIAPSTVQSVPGSLTVAGLDIAAPVGTQNLLLLNYAGTAVPLRVLQSMSIGPGGRLLNLSSGLNVTGAGLSITNAEVDQDGGVVAVSGGLRLGGSYYLTNGVVQVDTFRVGTDFSGLCEQSGGTVLADSVLVGSVFAPPFIPTASYHLQGGALTARNIDVGGGVSYAQVTQDGGLTTAQQLRVLAPSSPASYRLNAGALDTGRTEVLAGDFNEGLFEQTGGDHVITNELRLEGSIRSGVSVVPSRYALNGGTLTTPLLRLANYSAFAQTNGTMAITQVLSVENTNAFQRVTSYLAGGLLGCADFRSGGVGVDLLQTGGRLIVSNLLSFAGGGPFNQPAATYACNGGTLYANNIDLGATLLLGPAGGQKRRVENPGYFKLGGSLVATDIEEQLGRFILGTNATLDLAGTTNKLAFAPSGAEIWTPNATLYIVDWNGATNGGGLDQVYFGTDANGLTLAQLSQIRFVNPAGFPPGTNFATLLASGELVPALSLGSLTNYWTKPTSGYWEEPYWSLGRRPDASQTVEIINAGWKAVAIGSSTVQNFPESLTVSQLDLGVLGEGENVLLLNYAGTGVPLRVTNGMTIRASAKLVNLYSGLAVGPGGLRLANGEVDQDSGFVSIPNAPLQIDGSYNLTNGTLQTDWVILGLDNQGTFNQYGGSTAARALTVGGFTSTGSGFYNLYGGDLACDFLGVGGQNVYSRLLQAGGTSHVGTVSVSAWFNQPSEAFLTGGQMNAGTAGILGSDFTTAKFEQSGGVFVVTNALNLEGAIRHGVDVHPGSFVLSNGTLLAQSIHLARYGTFAQSNGTAVVSGALQFQASNTFARTTSWLTGGSFRCADVACEGAGENLIQTGGQLVVSNLFAFSGFTDSPPLGFARYTFSGGTLSAGNMEIAAQMTIGSAAGQTRRISNPGYFKLAGTLTTTSGVDESLGRFILGANATVDLGGGSTRLRFAPSSAEGWTDGALLSVSNWNGATNGGGACQLFFGQNAGGLTQQQLSQVRFFNPAGLPAGTYFAQLLSTGEAVPTSQPFLLLSGQGTSITLSWPGNFTLLCSSNVVGPYLPLPGATSPYSVDTTTNASRFFRLRGN